MRAFESGAFAGAIDIATQRMGPDGSRLWGEGGTHAVLISGSVAPERHPTMVPDGAGGVLVAFEAEEPFGEFAGIRDIWAQRMDAEGNRVWGGGDFPIIVTASVNHERHPLAVPDGTGGAIVVFTAELLVPEFLGDFDVWAQSVTSDAQLLWGGGLRPVFIAASDFPETQPAALSDDAGGAIVAFELVPGPEAMGNVDISVQRLGITGDRRWAGGEASVQVEAGPERAAMPALLSDGADGAVVLWWVEEDMHTQRVDAFGQLIAPTAVSESLSDAPVLPVAYALHPPSPNPFNAETTLRYDLPEATSVHLEVLDIAGQVITLLAEGHRPAGSHRLRWDGRTDTGSQIASGVYLARLRAGETARVRKLVLIR